MSDHKDFVVFVVFLRNEVNSNILKLKNTIMNICILRPIEKFSVFEINFCIFYGKIWKYWHQNLYDIIHTTVIIDFTTLWVEKNVFL